jgi:hypothetical protein
MSMNRPTMNEITFADVVEILEHEIAERQKALMLLKAIYNDALKGKMGRPYKYDTSDQARVASLIAEGKTHRAVAKMLGIPITSVGKIATRMGAKRKGNMSGGSRVITRSARVIARKDPASDQARAASLIAKGKTHRAVAKMLIPIASVDKIATRMGAKRKGNMRSGSRVITRSSRAIAQKDPA